MKQLLEALRGSRHAVAFTGAGVSTLCGIPDFRGPGGLYSRPGAEKLFDIEIFHDDPSFYYQEARQWIYGMGAVEPGKVHQALAKLEQAGILAGIVTQNIDMLHQRSGSGVVAEIHGSPQIHQCTSCDSTKTFDEICQMLTGGGGAVPCCGRCGAPYKPNITFFGESLPAAAFELAGRLIAKADLMLVLGSSLTVFPAAMLPEQALRKGVPLYIVNAQPTHLDSMAVRCYNDLALFASAVLEMPT